ncbi:hypothetical protein F0562_009992 [Nyssa sinensis]|uniref:Cation-transporting P-type ATPase C-terminal domain-containing protein n=1 Tax=Nyssa sinensis TaxID=561372 RepID=A0A5J4ZZT4_9ASTE|nr:hypothetical protein F0562_009992 [Nyssa sinensis]
MDALGALGMAASVSDPPPSDQIQFGGAAGPLITKTMWRNIVFQSLYQVTVLLILDLKGKAILDEDEKVLKAMIFNCYVLCQLFVLIINAGEIKKMNVLEGLLLHNNCWFLVVIGTILTLQVAAIEIPAAVIHAGRPEEDVKGAVIEASEFRNTSEEDRMKMIDKIRVMANTSPTDKLSMVQCPRRNGEVVAVTGTCSRDSSSLKEADVGLCMGDNSAEAAKESSDIVILDLNFVTIYEILKLGRCVCNNLKKLIQSQLILNIAEFYINLILVVSTSEVPLSPFQLLCVNLIMDALGALGMAASVSDPPPSDQIQFGGAAGPLITKTMWRNIVFQSLYQVTVLLILDLKGKAILDEDEKVLKAMIFNCYVLCQLFVLISNAGDIKKMNVLEGLLLHNNCWFLVVVGTILILQVAAIEIPAAVIHAGRLNPKQWCICVGIAASSMPIGWAARCASFSAQAL